MGTSWVRIVECHKRREEPYPFTASLQSRQHCHECDVDVAVKTRSKTAIMMGACFLEASLHSLVSYRAIWIVSKEAVRPDTRSPQIASSYARDGTLAESLVLHYGRLLEQCG